MMTSFGKRLRQFRELRGATLQQVADAAGCTKAYIWELEKREGKRPSAERLNAIAKFLKISIQDLLDEQDLPASPEDIVFIKDYLKLGDSDRLKIRKLLELLF